MNRLSPREHGFWIADLTSIRYCDGESGSVYPLAGSSASGQLDGSGESALFSYIVSVTHWAAQNKLLLVGVDAAAVIRIVDIDTRQVRPFAIRLVDPSDPHHKCDVRSLIFDRSPHIEPESALFIKTDDEIWRAVLKPGNKTDRSGAVGRITNVLSSPAFRFRPVLMACTARGRLIVCCESGVIYSNNIICVIFAILRRALSAYSFFGAGWGLGLGLAVSGRNMWTCECRTVNANRDSKCRMCHKPSPLLDPSLPPPPPPSTTAAGGGGATAAAGIGTTTAATATAAPAASATDTKSSDTKTAPPVPVSQYSDSIKMRAGGNELFRAHHYQPAINAYEWAVRIIRGTVIPTAQPKTNLTTTEKDELKSLYANMYVRRRFHTTPRTTNFLPSFVGSSSYYRAEQSSP